MAGTECPSPRIALGPYQGDIVDQGSALGRTGKPISLDCPSDVHWTVHSLSRCLLRPQRQQVRHGNPAHADTIDQQANEIRFGENRRSRVSRSVDFKLAVADVENPVDGDATLE